jgi:hypothetical protein
MNTWNTLPESYQQRVYNNTLATVKRQIQQGENPTLAMVISVETARDDNGILLDYLASEVALEEPEIRSTDSNVSIYNNCTDDELYFGKPGASGDYPDEADESDDRDAIPTASWYDGSRRNSRGLTSEPVMSTCMRARLASMRMRMRRKKHCKPIMDQRRMWRSHLGPRDVDGYEGEDGDDADADEEEEASQADDG